MGTSQLSFLLHPSSTPASTLTTTTARPSTQFKPLLSLPNTSLHISQNATKGRRQEARHQGTSCKGTSQTRSWKEDQCDRREEEENNDAQGDLLFIHLQSPQASPPRHWYLQPRHVNFELPGELAKHAVSEGTKAVTKYSSSTK